MTDENKVKDELEGNILNLDRLALMRGLNHIGLVLKKRELSPYFKEKWVVGLEKS